MKSNSLPANLKKLLSILSDNQYHSGTDIGKKLGLTRSGVWKLIKQLETLDIQIQSVTNKGYMIENTLEFLNQEKITAHLSATHLKMLDDFFIFDSIDSTNNYLVAHAKKLNRKNAVCFAEHQTAGRGRLGRSWVSPFLSNIYLSILWNFPFDLPALSGLNIVMGVSIIKVLQQLTKNQDLKLKWPNDVLWNNKKLSGILIDIIGEYNGTCSVVIGIGLNINMSKNLTDEIKKPWTAINQITDATLSRNKIAGALLEAIIENVIQFSKSGLTPFIDEWNYFDYLAGKSIKISTGTHSLTGIAQGIDEHGRLLLKLDNNKIETITSGDASILST